MRPRCMSTSKTAAELPHATASGPYLSPGCVLGGGGHCNPDKAAAVSILAVAIVGWREVGRLDRIGARAEGGRPGCRARVWACRGCRDRGQ